MTTRQTARTGRTYTRQTVHLLLAALAAVVIAVASQGWPSTAVSCEAATACDAA